MTNGKTKNMSEVKNFFILFIPCTVDKQFATLNQSNAQYFSLDYYIISPR
jgi:hypothetical protein